MWTAIKNWWLDRHAALELDDQFVLKTGQPLYSASLKEGRAFRLSGKTAHQWLLGERD